MKLNRNEHSRFVQWLDRTAEKKPLLWLPCILLIALALTEEHIVEYLRIVYSHRNTEKIVKEKPQLERKPLALRAVAMSLIMAFGFMFTSDLGQAVYADEYYYNDTSNTDWQNDINATGNDPFGNMLADEFSDGFFAGGDGSVENPYQVATAEQLNAVRYDLSANYIQIANIDLSNYHNWEPIGNQNNVFSGVYNGNNYNINNLTISIKSENDLYYLENQYVPYVEYIGLFGTTKNTTISNIYLNNVDIKISYGQLSNCGALAGTGDGNIYNIKSSGRIDIDLSEDSYMGFVGGILGSGGIRNSTNYINISANGLTAGVGGVAGGNWDGIESCINYGDIYLYNDNYDDTTVGGIVACSPYGDIIFCTNYGRITGINSATISESWVGGISGDASSIKISYCKNYGDVLSKVLGYDSYSDRYYNCSSGGILGAGQRSSILNCYNEGNITAISTECSAIAGGIGADIFSGNSCIIECVNNSNYVISQRIDFDSNGDEVITISKAGRIGGKNCKLDKNYSLNTTLVNEVIPTENIGHDQINGESLSKEEIEKAVENIISGSDINSSELTAMYGETIEADINNINMYESSCHFYITIPIDKVLLYGGNIYLRNYSDGSIHKVIRLDIEPEASGMQAWTVENGKIFIVILDINHELEASTRYYFDLSEVTINGQPYFTDINFKEKYSFKTDFGIRFGEQTFNFSNEDKHFWFDFPQYTLTNEFYTNEITNSNFSHSQKNKIRKYTNDEWAGSCEGISSVMMLQNNGYIRNCFSNKNNITYNTVGEYPIPSSPDGIVPYGSRDIINYMQILSNTLLDKNKNGNDIKTINYILEKAESIKSINDIFKMGYGFTGNDGKKYGHAVVIVGGSVKDNSLYVYDSNLWYESPIRKVNISIDDKKILFDGEKIFSINYVVSLNYAEYLPNSIKNKTRIKTEIQNIDSNVQLSIKNAIGNITSFLDDCTYQGTLVPDDVYYLATGEKLSEMMIILPSEPYYEINSNNGLLSYDIVNEDMFFAVKADNAEKSIVSAEDGVKLVNASGNFELTVSSNENMPYDMFDISGIANGNVDCQYVNSEVVVNLDNTSDTTITFYHDLKTEDYTVPAEYDKFVIGEQNNKEAVLVDTDGDGTYETDILNRDVHTHISAAEYSSDETGHWHNCTLCNEKLDFETHTLNDGVVTLEPTETTEGIRTFTCTVCGHISTEAIPVITPDHTVHTFDTIWHNDTTSHWHECTVCGEHADTARHDERNAVVTVQPTSTTAGTMTYYCSICGYAVRTETIPPTGFEPTYPVNPSPSYPTTTYPTNTVTQIEKEPYIYGDTLKSSWDAIIFEIDFAADGSTVKVNMNGTYELPETVVSHIQNRNINLELNMGSVVWTINGLDVTNPKTVNMRVSERANKIPASLLDNLSSELEPKEYRLYHSGDFGFKATLTLNVGKRYNDYYAVLYHYNTKTKQLEFIDESLVENKFVTFELTHASYYAVAFNGTEMYDDVSASAGVFENSVPIETSAMPETSGVTIPAVKLPQIMKCSNKKRRYRILKKRKLDDLVFVL